jgi:hypothetical protein
VAISYNSSIVTTNLGLCLDAGNPRSYPGSGTTWKDVSGTGNNGTLVNGPTYNSANLGSFAFDGIDDYVSVSGSRTLTEATFSVWLKRNGTQTNFAGILFSRGTSVTGLDFYSTTNNLGYHWNDAASSYGFNSALTTPDGAWCMGVLTVTATTATFYLCQSSGITTATNTVAHASTTLDALAIGRDAVGPNNRYMNGSIAQASLYNTALTADQVTQNFNATRGRYGL